LKTHLLNNCRKVVETLRTASSVAILHHWDADGIASAAILPKILNTRIFFYVPKIGCYGLEAINIEWLRSLPLSLVLILDYGLPVEDVLKLEKTLNVKVAVIDHHLNRPLSNCFCNPVAMGFSEENYPSTTWVIRDLFNVKNLDLYVALGIVGDLGKAIENHKFKNWVIKKCQEHGLLLKDLFKAVEAIDSCYRLVDYNCINHARKVLTEFGVKGVLNDTLLSKNRDIVRENIGKALEKTELIRDYGKVKLFKLECDNYLTSIIGRELAYRFRGSVIVFDNAVKKLGLEYIYVRSYSFNLRNILSKLKSKGFNVGGKDYVFVVTCKGKCGKEINTVLNTLLRYVGV